MEKTNESSDLSHFEDVKLTILMPCLDEAETLAVCISKALQFLSRTKISGEVLIADNGSTDGSQEIAVKAGARVVPVPEKGYGAALMGGIQAAKGDYIIMGDADDSYDFFNLEAFIDALDSGADLVLGNRFKGGIKKGAMPPLHRYLGNPVLSFIGRLFYNIPVGDFHCGLRGFRAEAIKGLNLNTTGMEFASEMVVKSALNKLNIAEVPCTLSPDGRARDPHLNTWQDGWRHLRFLLLHSPRWLFLYPAVFMILFGLTLVTMTAFYDFTFIPTVSIGVHSLLVGCFSFLIGSQLLSFAILSRQHALDEGLLPNTDIQPVLRFFSLERILQFAGLIFVLGIIGFVWSVSIWAKLGFGPLEEGPILRILSISLTIIATSVQLAGAAFLASVFRIRRN